MKPGGGIAFTAPDGLALFLKRSKDSRHPGEWNFPGGHVEEGETAEQGARREALEEVGHNYGGQLREVARTPIDDEGEEGVGLEDYITFRADVDKPFVPKLDNESCAYAWAPMDQPPEPLHSGVKDALGQMAKDQHPTLSKKTAKYRYPAEDPARRRCALCSMYRGEDQDDYLGRCTLVVGEIMASGDCVEFDRKFNKRDLIGKELAFDRMIHVGGTAYRRNGLAFDYHSARSYDADGRLHVNPTNISKANICPYRGDEIPGSEELGLEPDRVYQLLRDPDELLRAAETFNNVPLLSEHVPVSAEDHQPKLVIGSTGTDAVFEPPYLRNSLVVWDGAAIDEIERSEKKELSCAYRYKADMTPGTYQGVNYDGVMRDIVGNHVALVKEGRAGDDVVVGDSKETDMTDTITVGRANLTRKGRQAYDALTNFIKPKLAMDAKFNLPLYLLDVRRKTFSEQKPALLERLTTALKGKLAQDASVDGLASILDMIEAKEPEGDADPTPQHLVETTDNDMPDFLKNKGVTDDEWKMVKDGLSGSTPGRDEDPLGRKGISAGDAEKDDQPGGEGTPKVGGDAEEDKEEKVDKKAMDKAIAKATKIARDEAIKAQREINDAVRYVRPWVGELNMAFDSAPQVFKAALDALNVSTESVHPSAYKPILDNLPKPGSGSRPNSAQLANDAKNAADFNTMFPEAARIGIL